MGGKGILFNYFYETQAEQFTFYKIPKNLFTDNKFQSLSSDAKILYGLLLDRMSLSIKNHWMDKKGRVYIIFTLEQVMKSINCGKEKGVKILNELDQKIGLIERVKQEFGKPDLIYLKKFIFKKEEKKQQENSLEQKKDTNFFAAAVEVGKLQVSRSEKPKYRGRFFRL